jgi:sugar lactone lactonase YvrE
VTVRTLIDGLRFAEGPRWHDGAVWFSDMHDHRVLRVTPEGEATTVVEVTDDEPSGLGWLPDGRLLVVAMDTHRLLRVEHDGTLATHADLSAQARGSLNDMIVAADGTAYIGDMGHRVQGPVGERRPGQTFMVRPDGTFAVAADDLSSPNGHVLTDDGRTLIVAESGGARLTAFDVEADGTLTGRREFAALTTPAEGRPAVADGICLDAEGAIWYADPLGGFVARVREGGDVTDRVSFDGVIPLACVLGGADRRTLYVCVAEDWRHSVLGDRRTARIDVVDVDVPGAGRP